MSETLIRVDDLLVVEETGEIRAGDPWSLVEELQLRHREAGEQERQHAALRELYSRMLCRALEPLGRSGSDYGRTHVVAPTTVQKAEAAAVRVAVLLEVLTLEQAERLLIDAAHTLNVAVVQRHIDEIAGEDELLRARLHAQLIDEQPRSGYAVTRPPLKPAREVERIEVEA